MHDAEPGDLEMLGHRLLAAARAGDWPRVARLDADLSAALAALPPGTVLPAAPLRALVASHAKARRLCAAEIESVGEQVTTLADWHAASRAYADGEVQP